MEAFSENDGNFLDELYDCRHRSRYDNEIGLRDELNGITINLVNDPFGKRQFERRVIRVDPVQHGAFSFQRQGK